MSPAAAPTASAGWFDRVSLPVLGTLAFISSEVVFFGALIVAYLEYRGHGGSGPGPSDLDVWRTGLFSIALFASSATIWLADRRLRRDDQRGFAFWVGVTIVLGLVFLVGQGSEYTRLVAKGMTPSSNLFTSAFYALTGFHGAHVVAGLIALAVVAGLALAGDFRYGGEGRHVAPTTVSVYWHFVDAVWVVLFTLIYLWTLA
jgi:heme/copper-type cytochrome/quinol oxidase subunit 3